MMDETLTILPVARSIMCRPTNWLMMNAPVAFTSSTLRHLSRGSVALGAPHVMPALLNSTSIRPNRSSVAATNACACASSDTSHGMARQS